MKTKKGERNEVSTDDQRNKMGEVASSRSNERQCNKMPLGNPLDAHESTSKSKVANVSQMSKKPNKAQGSDDEGLAGAKLEDLATVEELASKYNDPVKFLAYVDEMVKASEDAKNKEWEDYVVLSTYHRLKGLERPIVFGLGWCEGVNTKTGELAGLLPHTFSLIPPMQFGVLPTGNQAPIEDERCIGFVCISRAIERCYLSGIETYRDWILSPSRFIKEIGLNHNVQS